MAAARLAFGTARLVEGSTSHEGALRTALLGGVKVVDTAASYGAGGAERAVGRVLASLPADVQKGVEVFGKAGYFLDTAASGAAGTAGIAGAATALPPALQHSLAPAFLRAEVAASHLRLGRRLDCVLVDSPERVLQPLVARRHAALQAAAERAAEAAEATHAATQAPEGGGRPRRPESTAAPRSPFLPDEFADATAADPPPPRLSAAAARGAANAAERAVAAADAALVGGRARVLAELKEAFVALEEEVRSLGAERVRARAA